MSNVHLNLYTNDSSTHAVLGVHNIETMENLTVIHSSAYLTLKAIFELNAVPLDGFFYDTPGIPEHTLSELSSLVNEILEPFQSIPFAIDSNNKWSVKATPGMFFLRDLLQIQVEEFDHGDNHVVCIRNYTDATGHKHKISWTNGLWKNIHTDATPITHIIDLGGDGTIKLLDSNTGAEIDSEVSVHHESWTSTINDMLRRNDLMANINNIALGYTGKLRSDHPNRHEYATNAISNLDKNTPFKIYEVTPANERKWENASAVNASISQLPSEMNYKNIYNIAAGSSTTQMGRFNTNTGIYVGDTINIGMFFKPPSISMQKSESFNLNDWVSSYHSQFTTDVRDIHKLFTDSSKKISVVICQDSSGSMSSNCSSTSGIYASKMKVCQQTTKFIAERLRAHHIGVVSFDSNVSSPISLAPISDIQQFNRIIDNIHPGSCTNLSGGLHASFEMMKTATSDVKYLMAFTDGMANVGITDRASLTRMIQSSIDEIGNVKLVLFGYGDDCDTELLQNIAQDVGGSYHYLKTLEDIPLALGEEFGTALETRQQNVTISTSPNTILINKHSNNDLLRQEEKKYLFRIEDSGSFAENTFKVSYLDCESGKTIYLEITGDSAKADNTLVSEMIHVQNVADIIQNASTITPDESKKRMKDYIQTLASLPDNESETIQRLIKTLQECIDKVDMCPPATFRSLSESTSSQRGGHFSMPAVALMRSVTADGVAESLSNPPVTSLYPGATTAITPSSTLRPTLKRS